jgi:uncharacterized protein
MSNQMTKEKIARILDAKTDPFLKLNAARILKGNANPILQSNAGQPLQANAATNLLSRMHFIATILFATITLMSCSTKEGNSEATENIQDYAKELDDWRADRISALKRPRSWTSLVGLTWLKEGQNTFGSDPSMDVRIGDTAPEDIGVWTISGDSLRLDLNRDVEVLLDDESVFNDGTAYNYGGGPPVIFHIGPLYWTIIKRSDLYGVRVWDTTYHLRSELTEIPHYDTDPGWKLEATVMPTEDGASITMDNAVGQSIEYPIAGYVKTIKDDVEIELIALDGGPDYLFLIFSDLTTDIETYPGGRYMYVPRGDSLGSTVMDFNKAYNPPCVFTAFATCLLPPKSNFISAEVKAGEKDYDHGSQSTR